MVGWIISARHIRATSNQRNGPLHYIPALSHPQKEVVTTAYSQQMVIAIACPDCKEWAESGETNRGMELGHEHETWEQLLHRAMFTQTWRVWHATRISL